MPLDLTQLSQITEPLLAWYEKNARVLPWRENTDAYRVWVSHLFPSSVLTLIPRRLACASPRFEQLPTSKYFF